MKVLSKGWQDIFGNTCSWISGNYFFLWLWLNISLQYVLLYLYMLCQGLKKKTKNNKNKPASLFIVNMLILNALPIITGRPKLCRLLSLQGERCLMLKMNTQKHSSVTASTAGLLIQHLKKCIKNHGQFVAVKDRVRTLIFELCIGR